METLKPGWKKSTGAGGQTIYIRDFGTCSLWLMPNYQTEPPFRPLGTWVVRENEPNGEFKILKGVHATASEACDAAHMYMKKELSRQIEKAKKVLSEL